MDLNMIITIGRQYGSGGREIGEKLAKRMNVPYYDKELLTEAARESGLSEELFLQSDEKPTNSLLYALAMGNSYANRPPLNHTIFMAQFETIKKIAQNGPCVIVGRCADYSLRHMKNMVSVFVHASMEYRLERAINQYHVPEKQAKGVLARTDKQRASYYNFYTDQNWSDVRNYDLALDSSKIGVEGAVDVILEYAAIKQKLLAK